MKPDKRPVPKAPHPEDLNGESFSSPGGKDMYNLMWSMNERLGKMEGKMVLFLAFIPPVLLMIVGAIIAGVMLQ